MTFLALDFETGGLELKERAPVTLGLAIFKDGEVLKSAEWVFKPIYDWKGTLRFTYTQNAAELHGYSLARQTAEGKDARQIYDEVLEFLGGAIWDRPIVSHNAAFDSDVWENVLYVLSNYDHRTKRVIYQQQLLTGPWICTKRIGQSRPALMDEPGSMKLNDLCQHFGIGEQGEIHGSEADAILAGKLYLALRGTTQQQEK